VVVTDAVEIARFIAPRLPSQSGLTSVVVVAFARKTEPTICCSSA